TQTVGTCLRYRVTGLAAEGAFFAILSLPPLVFGLAGSIGYLANQFEVETIDEMKNQIIELAGRALTADSVKAVIEPTLNDVLNGGGRLEVVSIGFVLALWSGSRALNVFVDTITIMYGMGGKRGIVKTRALSFTLYCVALMIGVVVLPLVLAGPHAIGDLLPARLDFLNELYWPVVIVLSVGFLNTLYHLSVPVRTPWVADLPGSALALSVWILGSFLLRWTLQTTVGGTSIYGPLAAPIAILLWLYLTAIAVLIGAALNAVTDTMWPSKPGAKTSSVRTTEASRAAAAADAESKQITKPKPRPKPGAKPAAEPQATPRTAPEPADDGKAPAQPERAPEPASPAPAGAAPARGERNSRARRKSGNVA
ncbi:MAG TPA: YhjD/YihY/BrkB family envelope integrity protein, partial [Kribbellaceae bacterium]